MPYTFTQAGDVMAVAEQEYGSAGEIRFTTFTSCIGVIARNGNTVTGVHLVQVAADGTNFDTTAADQVITLLGSYTQVVVLGAIDSWELNQNVQAGFDRLMTRLVNPTVYRWGDGIYGGRVANDVFEISVTVGNDTDYFPVT
jgi:hypothetical protein